MSEEFNYKEHHDQQILEWMKNGYGEQTIAAAPEHSYNLYVYVRDSTTAVGLLFYLHTLGYQVDDMWVQPWHLSEFMDLGNRFITLIGNRVGFGSMTYKTVEGAYLTDKEVTEAIDISPIEGKLLRKRQKKNSQYQSVNSSDDQSSIAGRTIRCSNCWHGGIMTTFIRSSSSTVTTQNVLVCSGRSTISRR